MPLIHLGNPQVPWEPCGSFSSSKIKQIRATLSFTRKNWSLATLRPGHVLVSFVPVILHSGSDPVGTGTLETRTWGLETLPTALKKQIFDVAKYLIFVSHHVSQVL